MFTKNNIHIYTITQTLTQVAYREAEALKRQDQLIAEELATQLQEDTKRKEQAERDREKRSKKKVRKWLELLRF